MGNINFETELNSKNFATIGKDEDNTDGLTTVDKLYEMINGKDKKDKFRVRVKRFDLMNGQDIISYEDLLNKVYNDNNLKISKIDRIAIQRDGSYFVIVEYFETIRKKKDDRKS